MPWAQCRHKGFVSGGPAVRRKRIELPLIGSLEKTHRPPLTGQAEYRYFPEVLDTRRHHHHP
jgi:hypothetical protein